MIKRHLLSMFVLLLLTAAVAANTWRQARSVFPGTLVAPALYIAGSDSQHFVPIADNIYRFSPMRAGPDDLSRFQDSNERIAISNLAELVRFDHQLIRNAASTPAA